MTRVLKKWRNIISKSVIYDSQKRAWASKALGATLIIIAFTAIPTIFGVISASFQSKFDYFVKNSYVDGQFILYGISLMVSSYTILHFHKKTVSAWWLFALLIFGVIYATNDILNTLDNQSNLNLLFWFSIIGLIVGGITCFYAQYTQQKNIPPNVKKVMDESVNDLIDKLEV